MSNSNRNYEKPQVIKIGHPIYTKHGQFSANQIPIIESIDQVSIDELTSSYGSPLFVFSENAIIDRFQKTLNIFNQNYPKVTFAWSYKTNYLKAVCNIFHKLGSLAEVVSEFEYERARSLGVEGSKIIYNGPLKSKSSLERAVKEGARIHFESFDEIADVEEICEIQNLKVKVGIRVNLNSGIFPNWTRFGFNLENGQVNQAIDRICSNPRFDLVGLHTHLGTFILESKAYQTAAEKLCTLASQIKSRWQKDIAYLDLGGGIPSLNRLKGIYQPPEVAIPNINEYAAAISNAIKNKFTGYSLPELVLECGRHLIDEAGYLITSVTSSKLLPDGRRAYIMDAGVNLLYTSSWYKPQIALNQMEKGLPGPSTLLGPLCMNIDVIEESLMLPRLPRGKKLILHPVGAYNVTQWMQFIQYRPAVVMIRKNGKIDLIRVRENLETMDLCERLPSDLGL